MTINNKSERNYRGKRLGWPVASYSGANATYTTHRHACYNTRITYNTYSTIISYTKIEMKKVGVVHPLR